MERDSIDLFWFKFFSLCFVFCTSVIKSDSAIAEPASGLSGVEISAVGQEICLENGVEVVVVADVHRGVSEDVERRHQRLRQRRSAAGDGDGDGVTDEATKKQTQRRSRRRRRHRRRRR